MRKLLFLFIIFSFSDTSAQLKDFFVRAGVVGSNSLVKSNYFLAPLNLGSTRPSFLLGKTIGGGLSYALPKQERFFIQTDLNYVERGLKIKTMYSYTLPGSSSTVRQFYNIKYNYIDATILLKQYNSLKNFKLGYGLGVTFGAFKDSRVTSNANYGTISQSPLDYAEAQERINKTNKVFDFAISGELGLDYPLNSKSSLGLNFRFNRSLFYSSKKENQNYYTPFTKETGIASRNLLLTFIYKYRIPEKLVKAN